MKTGVLDLLSSERGTLVVLLVTISTVLVVLKILTPEQWLEYTKWICVTLVASKTITGAVYTMKNPQPSSPEPEPLPTAAVVKE